MTTATAPTTPEEIITRFRSAEYSKAKKARLALEALRAEIGSQPWIERAIVSCDALDWGTKVDESGRPIAADGKPMTWKQIGL